MQEQESTQELTNYYQNIFTLKNGKQIEILTQEELKFGSIKILPSWKIKGFIKSPLLEEKEIQIKQEDVSAIESIKKFCIAQLIPWPKEMDNSGDQLRFNF